MILNIHKNSPGNSPRQKAIAEDNAEDISLAKGNCRGIAEDNAEDIFWKFPGLYTYNYIQSFQLISHPKVYVTLATR